jgi:hypothetical protein
MKTLLTITAIGLSMMASGQSETIKFPMYDTAKRVLVYFDTINVVKADSCLVIRRADKYCRTDCPDAWEGCLVYHSAPCWYEYSIILHSGEIIDPRRKISLH